jgi:hypothetical protein
MGASFSFSGTRRDEVLEEDRDRTRRLQLQNEVLSAVNNESQEALVRLTRLTLDSGAEMARCRSDVSAPAFLGLAAMAERYPRPLDYSKCRVLLTTTVHVDRAHSGKPDHRCGHGEPPLLEAFGFANASLILLLLENGVDTSDERTLETAVRTAICCESGELAAEHISILDKDVRMRHVAQLTMVTALPPPLVCCIADYHDLQHKPFPTLDLLRCVLNARQIQRYPIPDSVLFVALQTSNGSTERRHAVVKLLLERKADPESRLTPGLTTGSLSGGGTALHLLASHMQYLTFQTDTAAQLIAYGAQLDTRDSHGRTPHDLAMQVAQVACRVYGHTSALRAEHTKQVEIVSHILQPLSIPR